MKFQRSERREEDFGIDIAPLIDVVFLLLIFFMVTTTFDHVSQIRIILPKAHNATVAKEANPLVITIDKQGHYFLGGRELLNDRPATLYRVLKKAMALKGQGEKTPLVVRADANAPYQAIVTAMDVASQLGISRLSIATNKIGKAP